MKNKTLRITLLEDWSWERRALTFMGIFGGIWLLLEPLFAVFGGAGPLEELGLWRYLVLVVFAGIFTVGIEIFNRKQTLGRMNLISFTIILLESGTRYNVNAPEDMLTERFLDLFIKRVSKHAERGTTLDRHDMYNFVLMVKSASDKWLYTSPSKTLKENNVIEGSECEIEGNIKRSRVRRSLIGRIRTLEPINLEAKDKIVDKR